MGDITKRTRMGGVYAGFLLLAIMALAASCTALTRPVPPTPAKIMPGLSLQFLDKKINHLQAFPTDQKFFEEGWAGKPISQIYHQFNTDEVFDSGETRLICVLIQGFIKFQTAGEYALQAISNDGVRVFVNGERVIDDPSKHSDKVSAPGLIEVAAPGWQAIRVEYFQRKGTARLELHWKTPGSGDFVPVPAKVLGRGPV